MMLTRQYFHDRCIASNINMPCELRQVIAIILVKFRSIKPRHAVVCTINTDDAMSLQRKYTSVFLRDHRSSLHSDWWDHMIMPPLWQRVPWGWCGRNSDQDQDWINKTKTDFLVWDRSCPKTDGSQTTSLIWCHGVDSDCTAGRL